MNHMSKPQLISKISDTAGVSKRVAAEVLDALTDTVHSEIAAGGSVSLPGIGKIVAQERPDRMVRNPATGEKVHKPADRRVKIMVSKPLKDAVSA